MEIKSKKSNISYEDIMALKEPELTKTLKSLKYKSQNLDVKDKCFNSLLNNNNIYNNYLYLFKLNKYYHFDKTTFDENNVEKIYNKFKEIFDEYKEMVEKNKERESNINNIDKANEQEVKSKYFSKLKISEIIISLRKFFKVLLNIYDN